MNNQREIKFRVWDKEYKDWLADDTFAISNEGELLTYRQGGIMGGWITESNQENFITQQFTGLKDINKKDIYEGDIIKFKGHSFDQEELVEYLIGSIKWGHYSDNEYVYRIECWMIEGKLISNLPLSIVNQHGVHYGRGTETEPNSLEIIGNIFENKELLDK